MGKRCRVDNDKEISIMGDPWLPFDNNSFVSTNEPGLTYRKVANLMHTNRLV